MRWWVPPFLYPPNPECLSICLLHILGWAGTWETWPPGSRLLSCSTSGLYIRPLINPQWKPQYDILTGQAPTLDRSWFITTESQPTLIYFSFGEEGRLRTEKPCWLSSMWCQDKTSRLPRAVGHKGWEKMASEKRLLLKTQPTFK